MKFFCVEVKPFLVRNQVNSAFSIKGNTIMQTKKESSKDDSSLSISALGSSSKPIRLAKTSGKSNKGFGLSSSKQMK